MDEYQENLDAYYFKNGPCCAGCDWWQSINSVEGDCTKSAPVSQHERLGVLGITSCSRQIGAGHVRTPRDHHCGDFKDDFDWDSLPLAYLKRIGTPSL